MKNTKPQDNKFHKGNGQDGKHYCDKCYSYNDQDELIINKERSKIE